jgi:catechol 2,3-dioxygenase-like lactoylglutathione lyase family enzyme
MTPVRARRLDHTSVRIGDLARSREFYEGLLGLARAPRPDLGVGGVWYDLSGAQLHLIEAPKVMEGIDPTDAHFALEVESLATVRQVLDARAIPYLALGDAQLWIRDPDGNVVELCEANRAR